MTPTSRIRAAKNNQETKALNLSIMGVPFRADAHIAPHLMPPLAVNAQQFPGRGFPEQIVRC